MTFYSSCGIVKLIKKESDYMKKTMGIIIAVLLLAVITTIIVLSFNQEKKFDTIPQNYIACFKGETSETVKTTYLYEKGKKKKKKYTYINTIIKVNAYEDSISEEKIIKKGKLKKKKEIFKVIEENEADSYVILKKDTSLYSIPELKELWK